MKMGFASASPASAKRTDTATVDVHAADANIKRTLDADVYAERFIDEDAPAQPVSSGIIHSEPTHPSRIAEILETLPVEAPVEKIETPRLAVIRETPTPADSQDGITARAKVPSWDEIMFGKKAEEPTENEEPS